jgi:hypothetical protein
MFLKCVFPRPTCKGIEVTNDREYRRHCSRPE